MAEAKKKEVPVEKTEKKERTKIKPCSCKSEFQDKQNGAGLRFFRVTKKGEERCTVCHSDRRTKRLANYAADATKLKYPFLFK